MDWPSNSFATMWAPVGSGHFPITHNLDLSNQYLKASQSSMTRMKKGFHQWYGPVAKEQFGLKHSTAAIKATASPSGLWVVKDVDRDGRIPATTIISREDHVFNLTYLASQNIMIYYLRWWVLSAIFLYHSESHTEFLYSLRSCSIIFLLSNTFTNYFKLQSSRRRPYKI